MAGILLIRTLYGGDIGNSFFVFFFKYLLFQEEGWLFWTEPN